MEVEGNISFETTTDICCGFFERSMIISRTQKCQVMLRYCIL